jgi:hypothetical protein
MKQRIIFSGIGKRYYTREITTGYCISGRYILIDFRNLILQVNFIIYNVFNEKTILVSVIIKKGIDPDRIVELMGIPGRKA